MFGKKFGNMFGDMQEKQEALKEKLKGIHLESEAGNGAVKVTVNAARELVNLDIDPEQLAENGIEAIEDMVVIAVNRALEDAAEKEATETQKMLKDLLPPGLGGLGNIFGR